MGYVRFRHDAIGDSGFTMKDGKKVPAGRVVRQQYFMRALVNRVLSLEHRTQRAEFLQKAMDKKYIESDLNAVDWIAIADYLKDFKPESMKIEVLPGEPGRKHGASYWIPDEVELPQAVNRTLNFVDLPIAQTAINSGYAPSASTSAPAEVKSPVKIEVLNGTRKAGLAKSVAQMLRSHGYIVVKTGNAPSAGYNTSKIINYSADAESAQKIAFTLQSNDIKKVSSKKSKSDITVIIGKDYVGSVLP